MNDPRTDEQLLQIFQRDAQGEGGREAAAALLKRWRGRIHGWCWHVMRERDLAEDLAQDCLLQIFRALPTFEPRAKVSSWIYAIVRNRCRSEMRRSRPDPLADDDAERLVSAELGPEQEFDLRAEEERVLEAMREALDDQERAALWLRAYEEMSVEDITRVLDVDGTSGARGLLQTARRKLRAALEARGGRELS